MCLVVAIWFRSAIKIGPHTCVWWGTRLNACSWWRDNTKLGRFDLVHGEGTYQTACTWLLGAV